MFNYSNAPIKKKLRILLGMSIILMLFIAGSILLVNSFFSSRNVLNHEISALAEVTALSITPSIMFYDQEGSQQTLETLAAHHDIVYAAVIRTEEQHPFAVYKRDDDWQFSNKSKAIFNHCEQSTFSLSFLYTCKPLVFDGVNAGKIVLVISLYDIYQRLLTELTVALLSMMLASLLIFYVLGKFSNKMAAPILQLLAISERVSETGKYENRAIIESRDEIGRLGAAFNIMLEKIQFWHEALNEKNDNLEQMVESRTLDLEVTKNEALALADKAQKANIAKSEFLSVMSHEIRTPLNAMLGYADLMNDMPLDREQQEYLGIINQSGVSLLHQINDILDFSKIEAGKMELDYTWFDLYELLINVLTSQRQASSKKSLMLSHYIGADLPRYVYGDEQKIRQMLCNLLSNSVKFTEFGSILLSVEVEHTNSSSCGISFSVKDTGIGISEDKQVQLFDPFTQSDASMTRKYGGTGLGLSIVKRMATLLEGSISLNSKVGLGSEFMLTLPLVHSAESSLDIPAMKEQISQPLIAVLSEKPDCELVNQLERLGYGAEHIETGFLQGLKQQPGLADKYTLLLFAQGQHELALDWHQYLLATGKKMSVVWCVEELMNNTLKNKLADVPSLKVSDDALDIVEQINRLLSIGRETMGSAIFSNETHILVVEDNPVNLLMVQNILKNTGLIIHSAVNGQVAVELFKTHKFALILMDCQMPLMDGYTATQEIRLIESCLVDQHTPIIALTANAFKEDREACMEAGMDDFLCKPFKKKQLLGTLEPWLKRNTVASMEVEDVETDDVSLEGSSVNSLDSAMLKELMEMDEPGSNDFISQISSVFFNNAEQLMQQIEDDFSKKAVENIAKFAHQLKSSSMNVAAKELSELFKQLESKARKGDFQQAEKLWQPIVEEHRQVEIAYKNLLRG